MNLSIMGGLPKKNYSINEFKKMLDNKNVSDLREKDFIRIIPVWKKIKSKWQFILMIHPTFVWRP